MSAKPTYEELEKRVSELEQAEYERDQAQRELRRSEESYRLLAENVTDVIWTMDINRRFTYFSRSVRRLLGFTPEEAVSRTLKEFMTPDSYGRAVGVYSQEMDILQKGANSGQPAKMELDLFRKDGTVVATEVQANFVYDESGKANSIIGIIRDITDRRHAEEALRESQSLLEQSQKIADIGSFVWDLQNDFLKWSENMYTIHGLSVENFKGKLSEVSRELIHPEDLPRVEAEIAKMTAAGTVWPMEFRLIRPDGQERIMRSNGRFEFNENGEPIKCIGVHQDITRQKRTEEALRESEEQVQAKLDAILSPEGDVGVLQLGDIVDTEAVQDIMDVFYSLTHIGVAVLDMQGRVLVATGWQDICIKFHRVHPETSRKCHESDLQLSSGVAPGTYKLYRCKNNMWDIATPIMVGERHLGNLFLGQFLFDDELPDYDVFREQARQYGFDETAYLEALDRVPRWNRETVDAVMNFYTRFANLISRLSYSNLKLARTLEERRMAEEELRQSENLFRTLFDASPLSIFALRDNQYIFANPAAAHVLGYERPESIVGLNAMDTIAPEYRDILRERMAHLRNGETNETIEIQVLRRDGERLWTKTTSVPIELDGRPAVLFIGRDITREKWAQRERERLLFAIEHVAESIIITDAEGIIQYVNPACETSSGYTAEEVIGQNPDMLRSDVQDEAHHRNMWQTINNGWKWQGRMVNKRKDGSLYTEEVSISPILDETGNITNFVSVQRDITSEIDMEKRLAQAQKMEAIGNLAGGIAHDFNNILSPIMIHAEMAMMELPDDSPLQMNMEQITLAGDRASELVRQILTFARRTEKDRVPLKASLIVKEAVKFLRSTIPSTVRISYDLTTDIDTVFADPTQMHQIVMNLCTNAVHAMRAKGGKLKVILKDELLTEGETDSWVGLRPGKYLKMSVKDTGVGIAPENVDKIFDPYFTTKGPGQGTGLGLAVIHGIVQSYGGQIAVESEVGKGTTFHVLLPVADVEVLPDRETRSQLPRGNEHILFVDDEKAAIIAIQPMLETLGYRVTARDSSTEALELFRQAPDAFDLVITDQTMPNMTGNELARHMMALQPDIPIILCTGFSETIDEEEAQRIGISAFVFKPIAMREMAGTIRRVLERGLESDEEG